MKRRFLAPSPSRRAAAAVLAAAGLTAAVAGCSTFSPVQTDEPYVPADGVPADVGPLAIRNLLVVDGGTLSGSAINTGGEALEVQLATQEGGSVSLSLDPREQVNLGDEDLTLSGLTVEPGGLVTVLVESSAGGSTVIDVPVLAAAGPYATMTPAATTEPTAAETTEPASAETTEPAAEATATETATEEPTATATTTS